MDVSFLIRSVRRYWWLFAVCVLLGLLPGLAQASGSSSHYESEAILLVGPPSESRVQVSFTNDPDRYVLGQVSVLQSQSIAERVANTVGGGETAQSVSQATTIGHEPKTDIVQIKVATEDPTLSPKIADAYLDVYFLLLEDQVSETRQPEIDELNRELDALQVRIAATDAAIATALQPYLPDAQAGAAGNYPPIPGVDQVAPELDSQRTALQAEFDQILATRTQLTQLDLSAKLRITTKVVQRGSVPTEPTAEPGRLLLVAGLIGGSFLGLVLCGLVTRLSSTAVAEDEIANALGVPVFGQLPKSRVVARNRRAALEQVPAPIATFVDGLAVQLEASAGVASSLTIAVVGVERASGATTLALALANRLAMNSSRVVVVDVDVRNSEITDLFAARSPGIAALLADAGPGADAAGSTRGARNGRRLDPYTPTLVPGVQVVGVGSRETNPVPRRQDVPRLIAAASANAHVVVFDAGPLLETAATIHLANLVDAVVLALPVRRLSVRVLGTVAAQLRGRRGDL
ncbi:MAG: hypothetical protein RLZZ362_1307, partial [Actinomycetota bacterium]